MAFTSDKTRQGAAGAGVGGYTIDNSLRFDGTSYLSKTFGTPTNNKIFTFSCWYKRGNIKTSGRDILFEGGTSSTAYGSIYVNNNSQLRVVDYRATPSVGILLMLTAKLRDPSAWYNIVVSFKSTSESTASDRIKIYINGVRNSTFDSSWQTFPDADDNFYMNSANNHMVGYGHYTDSPYYLDGYLAEVNFIDGQALDSTHFGEFGDYGEWKPKAYDASVSGAYGTNGFYLNFKGGGIIAATGGTVTTVDVNYKVHSFIANGTFTPNANGYVEYLVIAGAGGGGRAEGGGGGAGGYRTGMLEVTANTEYSITVGYGGAGATGSPTGTNGDDSVFSSITAIGGGGGGSGSIQAYVSGLAGGSGGGAANNGGQSGAIGTGTVGQGFNGGDDDGGANALPAGGGGGSSAVGADGSGTYGGVGGAGTPSSINGSVVTRAGGGGGGAFRYSSAGGAGGSGGGGAGQGDTDTAGVAGTVNSGSGGGGGGYKTSGGPGDGGAGGSGIVIIRYQFQ